LMNKQMGLSLGHTRQVLQQGFGLTASRAGISRALARLADKAAPTYQGLIVAARQSLVNVVDETGWRVGGRLQWMRGRYWSRPTFCSKAWKRGSERSRSSRGSTFRYTIHTDRSWCAFSIQSRARARSFSPR